VSDTPPDSDLRTIGVLGGMSPASTTHYYDRIVAGVNEARGGHTSAPVVVYSVDFGTVAPMIDTDDWDAAGDYLAECAEAVAAAGADVLLLATNTMHRVADRVAAAPIPFVHIVDPVATAARDRGIETIGVLGTQTTMAADFYHDRFATHGVDTVVPDAPPGRRSTA
jgi:Aspartate racemase